MVKKEVKRALAALVLLLFSSCATMGINREFDHRPKTRLTRAFLGQANQICLPWKKDTTEVDIFVIPKHPGRVKFILQDSLKVELVGESVQLHLAQVTIGAFKADIYLDDEYQLTVSWSVWDCGPRSEEDRNLYRPTREGSPGGLKGYCPECECDKS